MKYLFTLLSLIISEASISKGQTSFIQLDGKKYDILDTSYHLSDASHAIFYENNGEVFWKLRNEIRELDFDHCNHSFVFFLYVDTTGQLTKIQMLEGSAQSFVDTIVFRKVDSIQHVIPVNYNGIAKRSLIVLRFRYFVKSDEESLMQDYTADKSRYLYQKITLMRHYIGGTTRSNECEDDLYFYNEGIKCYNEVKYSKAIYNFSQALEVNPRDLEAQYYLGLSYQKNDNLKKACQCFSGGVLKGHEESIKMYDKFCTGKSENK